jgi:hypothetical protein
MQRKFPVKSWREASRTVLSHEVHRNSSTMTQQCHIRSRFLIATSRHRPLLEDFTSKEFSVVNPVCSRMNTPLVSRLNSMSETAAFIRTLTCLKYCIPSSNWLGLWPFWTKLHQFLNKSGASWSLNPPKREGIEFTRLLCCMSADVLFAHLFISQLTTVYLAVNSFLNYHAACSGVYNA